MAAGARTSPATASVNTAEGNEDRRNAWRRGGSFVGLALGDDAEQGRMAAATASGAKVLTGDGPGRRDGDAGGDR
ncbi:hypothetical protein E2562_013326 [Oryza meyeriana var. granulata]|uniref:DUF834 domain-containing protein n=1 Tax=Oryza meyeriana var. granulata TaxID=110450 RepID=A0A6G1D3Q6_9ORYZ|nr:hypothetical protein E2562_013326 [Oryza meyeriana var. granulata]